MTLHVNDAHGFAGGCDEMHDGHSIGVTEGVERFCEVFGLDGVNGLGVQGRAVSDFDVAFAW